MHLTLNLGPARLPSPPTQPTILFDRTGDLLKTGANRTNVDGCGRVMLHPLRIVGAVLGSGFICHQASCNIAAKPNGWMTYENLNAQWNLNHCIHRAWQSCPAGSPSALACPLSIRDEAPAYDSYNAVCIGAGTEESWAEPKHGPVDCLIPRGEESRLASSPWARAEQHFLVRKCSPLTPHSRRLLLSSQAFVPHRLTWLFFFFLGRYLLLARLPARPRRIG